ncbi:ubiquitin-conjugating enzyme/RWD-like protein [Aspergillus aurantiobrunneus]
MVLKLRRLAADHAALHEELPPNYLFPPDDAQSSASDDITQLMILLAGPQGTPYSQGLWRLHLKLPQDYPKSPPKATFKTRIWHPNMEETTGAVCVDTLKRDWKSTLTLKDVLITISCLLIYPNPDSALNSTAGALLQENYDAFARQAKLMTSIHAPIPADMRNEVMEAKMRGEESGTTIPEQEDTSRSFRSRKGTRVQSVTMKKKPTRKDTSGSQPQDSENNRPHYEPLDQHHELQPPSDDENENLACASKENDPSLSPSPVKMTPPLSPRKNAHGKRPLSVLTTSLDMDPVSSVEPEDMDTTDGMTSSERNIAANATPAPRGIQERDSSPQRKSPKLSVLNRSLNKHLREDNIGSDVKIYEDEPSASDPYRPTSGSGEGKENPYSSSCSSSLPLKDLELDPVLSKSQQQTERTHLSTLSSSTSQQSSSSSNMLPKPVYGTRKVSGSGLKKAKPRIGIRRL